MIGITFIGSGSKGNSALLQLGGKFFLFDAGLSCKRIREFLVAREMDIQDLSGIFVTHEHDDHIKGLRVLLGRHDLPLYCTRGTRCALENKKISVGSFTPLSPGKEIEIDHVRCFPFKVPHDATEPVGMRFESDGRVLTLATDLGHVSAEVLEYTRDADILCLESNYDEEMLRGSSYPSWLKRRIRSPLGHLPNEGVRGVLSRMKKVPQALILMHISQESNTPVLALEALEPFLDHSGAAFRNTHLSLTFQDEPGETLVLAQGLSDGLKKSLISRADDDFCLSSTG